MVKKNKIRDKIQCYRCGTVVNVSNIVKFDSTIFADVGYITDKYDGKMICNACNRDVINKFYRFNKLVPGKSYPLESKRNASEIIKQLEKQE
jgi:hypothetical protein